MPLPLRVFTGLLSTTRISLLWVVLASLLPVATMVGGGIAAAFHPPGARLRSAILHVAAGVVFAVVAVELLPEVMRTHEMPDVALGFALGIGTLLTVRGLTEAAATGETGTRPTGLLVGVAVDLAVDGLLLGIAFAAGAKAGKLLALALTIELLSLGLATATALGRAGTSRRRTIATTGGLALLFLGVAAAGASVLRNLTGHPLAIMLAFGSAALLFLVTEELLVEAHEEPETPVLTATFFVGFLLFLLLGMAA
jgi:ZIP family zinc transporter